MNDTQRERQQETEKMMDKFSGSFWRETTFDVARASAVLPALFDAAGQDFRALAETFSASLKKEKHDPEEERAWMMLTSTVSRLVGETMEALDLGERERLLYVLRVCCVVVDGFLDGLAFMEAKEETQ